MGLEINLLGRGLHSTLKVMDMATARQTQPRRLNQYKNLHFHAFILLTILVISTRVRSNSKQFSVLPFCSSVLILVSWF